MYIPSGVNGKAAQLQVTGIMTADEVENVEGLLDPQSNTGPTTNGMVNGTKVTLKTDQVKADAAANQLYQDWKATVER
jgi:hypothetical protein